jgi:hypothetical protein
VPDAALCGVWHVRMCTMPRRTAPSRDGEAGKQSPAARDVVLQDEAAADARAEENRQIRAALAEYFSILQEWSLNCRPAEHGFDLRGDQSEGRTD